MAARARPGQRHEHPPTNLLDDPSLTDAVDVERVEVVDGYQAWAPTYDDAPNAAFGVEVPVLAEILGTIPPVRDADGRPGRLVAHRHTVGDHLRAGLSAGPGGTPLRGARTARPAPVRPGPLGRLAVVPRTTRPGSRVRRLRRRPGAPGPAPPAPYDAAARLIERKAVNRLEYVVTDRMLSVSGTARSQGVR
ncbi:hypothetical protein BJF79_24020 [Actinomadura sp. CNU-125]|uniref:hypothetical protein n=1 Tax=Actinomadura sp. CNU-125 TaxID=1904961 RepID=UPI00095CC9C7|nr:hypothetical protein [Actinomadura sp. CNU-125]OLT11547.1 hypothetical protein BJF79_24020 [Actinomadura sp. CNU-125]